MRGWLCMEHPAGVLPGPPAVAVGDGGRHLPGNAQLLAQLRFWVADQCVALNVLQNYRPILQDMRARGMPARAP